MSALTLAASLSALPGPAAKACLGTCPKMDCHRERDIEIVAEPYDEGMPESFHDMECNDTGPCQAKQGSVAEGCTCKTNLCT